MQPFANMYKQPLLVPIVVNGGEKKDKEKKPDKLVCLGEGTYGTVYKLDNGNAWPIAMKVTKNTDFDDFQATQREIQAHTILKGHPCIISFLGYQMTHHSASIYMECAVTDLHKTIFSKSLTPATTKTVIKHVLEGLYFCHRVGIVHRDLRPDNILLSADGRWKLADFGSAVVPGIDEIKGATYAHQSFRAPEMFIGIRNKPPQDIWSLACVIAVMVSGCYLFYHEGNDENIFLSIMRVFGIPECWRRKVWIADEHKIIGLKKALPVQDYLLADLLAGMFQCDPSKRLTAAQCLQHAYFQEKVDAAPLIAGNNKLLVTGQVFQKYRKA